jgi:hypothetical protein
VAGLLVLSSLSRLSDSGRVQLENMRVLTYLVHAPSPQPAPSGASMAGPADRFASGATDISRYFSPPVRFPLGERERKTKEEALRCYASQQFLLAPLVSMFVTPFESFAQVHPTLVTDRSCSWNRLPAKG